MHRTRSLVRVAASWLVLAVAALPAVESITIFAAASTTDAVRAVARAYEAAHGVAVHGSFASSSTLAKQVIEGAPADLFLSADQQWMDHLAERGAIDAASRVDLLANELVIITPAERPLSVTVTEGFDFAATFAGRLAIGDPTHVPAGIYAREAFIALGWWEALRGRLAPAVDVRATLKLVELGEADAGVVYATDARVSSRVVVAARIPAGLHTPIRYPVALTATAGPAAAAFLAYLRGAEAQAMFAAAGFTAPSAAGAVDDDEGAAP
ncbi:MAG TPA: molybdate ABC transporter substrate-binding protein [Planctomycetota bacterium]|nr:molybdate ABC transporter substrate-binding protein [Planctomycetota bacterium]